MREILRALEKNEPVTILYRGKKKGVLYPAVVDRNSMKPVSSHRAVGMWKDRKDMRDVEQFVRDMRKGRPHAV
jgi:hypothetical protein